MGNYKTAVSNYLFKLTWEPKWSQSEY